MGRAVTGAENPTVLYVSGGNTQVSENAGVCFCALVDIDVDHQKLLGKPQLGIPSGAWDYWRAVKIDLKPWTFVFSKVLDNGTRFVKSSYNKEIRDE